MKLGQRALVWVVRNVVLIIIATIIRYDLDCISEIF